MQDDAAALIAEEGKSLTLRRAVAGAYDPATSSAEITATDVTVKGMILNYRDSQRDGTLVQSGDRKAVLTAKGLSDAPQQNDVIIDGSDELNIVGVSRIEEAGVPVVYVCQVRK